MDPDNFKFPDEVEDKKPNARADEEAFEVEIVDDTPPADRGRMPLNKKVEDPTEDELEEYGARSQQRIKELTHARHDERRAKEAAVREREEALRVAQQLIEENKKLRGFVNTGTEAYAQTMTKNAEMELDAARREYKSAQEAYDNDAMMAAQEKMLDAKLKLESAKNFKPTPLQNSQDDVQRYQTAPEAPRLDDKTLRWQEKNQWFGTPGYEEMTAFALGLHQKLVATGVDPRSDEYFDRVDGRLKQVFPEMLGSPDSVKAAPIKKPANVVASATRSSGAKKIVKLTTTQARLADKYGLSHKQYAQEILKLEAQNG
jgi:predicted DNA binding CopG/RHH family protein